MRFTLGAVVLSLFLSGGAAANEARNAKVGATFFRERRKLLSPTEIGTVYASNELGADAKLVGARIALIGVIARVEAEPPTVWMRKLTEGPAVRCVLQPAEKKAGARLRKGALVIVNGTGRRDARGFLLADCAIESDFSAPPERVARSAERCALDAGISLGIANASEEAAARFRQRVAADLKKLSGPIRCGRADVAIAFLCDSEQREVAADEWGREEILIGCHRTELVSILNAFLAGGGAPDQTREEIGSAIEAPDEMSPEIWNVLSGHEH